MFGFDCGFDSTADQGDTWRLLTRRGAPRGRGRADAARCAGSMSPWWTSHLTPKGYAISTAHSKTDGAGVRAGQWLAEEEAHGGGTMAGDSVLAETTF